MADPSTMPTAEPLLIDQSGVAHYGAPTIDLDDEGHTPPDASSARVTVAIPAPAARSASPAATAADQAASEVNRPVISPVTVQANTAVPPPTSSALVRQPSPGPLSRVDQFRQAYTGASDASPERSSVDPTAPSPLGSEDQTPAHLQQRLAGLASQIQNFATAAAQQVASSEQSLLVSFSSSGGAPAHPLDVVPEIRVDCMQSTRIFFSSLGLINPFFRLSVTGVNLFLTSCLVRTLPASRMWLL